MRKLLFAFSTLLFSTFMYAGVCDNYIMDMVINYQGTHYYVTAYRYENSGGCQFFLGGTAEDSYVSSDAEVNAFLMSSGSVDFRDEALQHLSNHGSFIYRTKAISTGTFLQTSRKFIYDNLELINGADKVYTTQGGNGNYSFHKGMDPFGDEVRATDHGKGYRWVLTLSNFSGYWTADMSAQVNIVFLADDPIQE